MPAEKPIESSIHSIFPKAPLALTISKGLGTRPRVEIELSGRPHCCDAARSLALGTAAERMGRTLAVRNPHSQRAAPASSINVPPFNPQHHPNRFANLFETGRALSVLCRPPPLQPDVQASKTCPVQLRRTNLDARCTSAG